MQEYGIIVTLTMKNDYSEDNQPITTIAAAAQQMAGKVKFCTLECSQSYHCIAIADEQSIQLLSFTFGMRTFAFLRIT